MSEKDQVENLKYIYIANWKSVLVLKGLRHDILRCFLGRRKLLLIGRKP